MPNPLTIRPKAETLRYLLLAGNEAAKKPKLYGVTKAARRVAGVDLPAPDPDAVEKSRTESAIDAAETAEGAINSAGIATAIARNVPRVASATARIAPAVAAAERATPVVGAALTAVDAGRMALSQDYREAVRQRGSEDAEISNPTLFGDVGRSAEFLFSRPAAAGSYFFSLINQLDTDRINNELRADAKARYARDMARRLEYARKISSGQLVPKMDSLTSFTGPRK